MATFSFTHEKIDDAALRSQLFDPVAGGYTSFEGWVRNHNEGLAVRHLEYEAFEPLAIKEGERIVAEAIERFSVEHAACVHRIGDLAIGEMAVWVGVSARHRDEAFRACRYIIDEVKHRVPIWKKEHYVNGDSGWVNCERCAAPSAHDHAGHTHHDATAHEHAEHHHASPHPTPNSAFQGVSAEATAPPGGQSTQQVPHPRVGAPIPDYSRQIALKEVGVAGQAKLRATRVLVVGCGGLGVPVISYLAGAGIGRLGLVDGDRLEPSNLHRQTMFALADVGKLKAELAADRVRALNPDVDVRAYPLRLDALNATDLIAQHDLVIDCTDNFTTKFLLNDFCVQLRKPAIFASVYQYEGQLQIVRPGSACLRCVWPEATRDGIVGNCAEAGVLGPVPGIFGGLQAFEAMKLLLDLPGQLTDELLMFDLLTLSISHVRTRRASSCPEHAISRATAARAAVVAQANSAAIAASTGDANSPGRVAANAAPRGGTADLEVTFDSLDQAYEAGFDIVDIREPRELVETPAPSSHTRHVPMAQLLYGQPPFEPAGKSLLVCASGKRSFAATQELRSRGLGNVYSLRGGIAGLRARLLT
jgi:molybdopterin/thiamine biosynthesis adenylyltransferase/molybdopterin synthase catalytic subunit/rhodanese-related sulfurtransferase